MLFLLGGEVMGCYPNVQISFPQAIHSGWGGMQIIGLTGGIGSGKSTVARCFARLGVPVFDADATVHQLLSPQGAAFGVVSGLFPQAVVDGQINRAIIREKVFTNKILLKQLEAILHPLVSAARVRFTRAMQRRKVPVIVWDIPLLFETGIDKECDTIMVVTVPEYLRHHRVSRRSGLTPETIRQIHAHQWQDAQKTKQADIVIHNGLGKAALMRSVQGWHTALMA